MSPGFEVYFRAFLDHLLASPPSRLFACYSAPASHLGLYLQEHGYLRAWGPNKTYPLCSLHTNASHSVSRKRVANREDIAFPKATQLAEAER